MVWERDADALQSVVEQAPPARQYFSDGFSGYAGLMYKSSKGASGKGASGKAVPGVHAVAPGKSLTYSAEGDNAELRHYLARLGRRSRCFSRCLWALARAVALFVYAWNRRQLFKRQFPKMPAHVCDFVADLI